MKAHLSWVGIWLALAGICGFMYFRSGEWSEALYLGFGMMIFSFNGQVGFGFFDDSFVGRLPRLGDFFPARTALVGTGPGGSKSRSCFPG